MSKDIKLKIADAWYEHLLRQLLECGQTFSNNDKKKCRQKVWHECWLACRMNKLYIPQCEMVVRSQQRIRLHLFWWIKHILSIWNSKSQCICDRGDSRASYNICFSSFALISTSSFAVHLLAIVSPFAYYVLRSILIWNKSVSFVCFVLLYHFTPFGQSNYG